MSSVVVAKSVGELVVEKPSRSRVFEGFKIDYCCGGKRKLGDACVRAGVSPDDVVAAIAESDRNGNSEAEHDWSNAPLGELIDPILNAHHAYLRRELPRLSPFDPTARNEGNVLGESWMNQTSTTSARP
jgi:regulator of cell morphogenesis and NO signaling